MPRVWPLAARCSLQGVVVALLVALVTVSGGIALGTTFTVALGVLLGATFLVFALHGAWRMADGLVAFAEEVPAQPQVRARLDGEARLVWPGLGLEVEGRAGLLREPDLEAEVAGQPLQAPPDEAPVLAEEALSVAGVRPAGEATGEAK